MISRKKEKISFHGTLFFLGIGAGFILAELLFVYLGTSAHKSLSVRALHGSSPPPCCPTALLTWRFCAPG